MTAPFGREPLTSEGGDNVAAARALAASLVDDDGLMVFMAPGSRNTPLAIAFDELAGARGVVTHVLLDERVAAFAALGAGRASRKPAVVVCTSGTAGGHFLPALMEADQGRVPLIAVTADRPPELHHCGAPQTIPQEQLFRGYVRWATTLPVPGGGGDRSARYVASMGMRARVAALGSPPGPVHINAPFRKPLFGAHEASPARATRATIGQRQLDPDDLHALERRLSHVERGVIHLGPLTPATTDAARLGDAAAELARSLGWPLLIDGASGVPASAAVRHGEILARSGVIPDAALALRIGGAPTNAHLAGWLGDLPSILVDPDGAYLDPEARCDTLLVADPIATCRALAALLQPAASLSSWTHRWLILDRVAAAAIDAGDVGVAGIAAARAVTALGAGHRIHVASSMAVRDVDAFANGRSPVQLTSNRGVNGIDGTIATALGIACASGEPTTALLGDLAFVHDVGGLLAACKSGVSLTLVVVNNAGGSIFEMLPIADQIDRGTFERLFATPQGHDLGAIATAAGASHAVVAPIEIASALAAHATGVRVIEVRQDRDDELAARAALWTRVSAELRAEARR